ncbi:hypothetical protein HPB51_027738 [Rhipicephalus microplus]|uniref:C2H2-type domain-containing protein n=1 Tax=Rhipicephalus microplus TaxID=6941 RepID=A0A9J6CZ95_RHIMP|nr:hypothetical protein HPB51_027738 [Rhipicephalus microplus]
MDSCYSKSGQNSLTRTPQCGEKHFDPRNTGNMGNEACLGASCSSPDGVSFFTAHEHIWVFDPKAFSQLSAGVVHSKAETHHSPLTIDSDEDTQDAPENFGHCGSDEYIEGSLDGADFNVPPGQHKCPVCLRTYVSPVLLEKHKCPGKPEKRYTCHICFRELNREGHLVAHMRVHTGEKPFKCTICSRAFRQKSNLTVHMRQHTTGGSSSAPCALGPSLGGTICRCTFSATTCCRAFRGVQLAKDKM